LLIRFCPPINRGKKFALRYICIPGKLGISPNKKGAANGRPFFVWA
jgi:hypothetical protein